MFVYEVFEFIVLVIKIVELMILFDIIFVCYWFNNFIDVNLMCILYVR